jgi:endonuclease/exonuclease/phosphatase family metal-dependent hydrolase
MTHRIAPIACLFALITPGATAEAFKVVTYKIASGAGGEWKSQPIEFTRLVSHILQLPDIGLPQEVQGNFARGREPVISQPEYRKTRLGMNGHYMADTKTWWFWDSLSAPRAT